MEELAAQLAKAFLDVLTANPGSISAVRDLLTGLRTKTTGEDKGTTDEQADAQASQAKQVQARRRRRRRRKRRKILQCRRCQQLGHAAPDCAASDPACGVCALPHMTSTCVESMRRKEEIHRKCALCHGLGHSSPSYKCPVRLAAIKAKSPVPPSSKSTAPVLEVDVRDPGTGTHSWYAPATPGLHHMESQTPSTPVLHHMESQTEEVSSGLGFGLYNPYHMELVLPDILDVEEPARKQRAMDLWMAFREYSEGCVLYTNGYPADPYVWAQLHKPQPRRQ